MKHLRAALTSVVTIAVIGWIAHQAAPLVSDQWASVAIQTGPFRITSSRGDSALAKRVAIVLESEYNRVSSVLGHQLREPVKVRVTSTRWLYNLSCGIPVPTPPGDGFDGAAGDRGVIIMLPRDWQSGGEPEVPDRGRSVAIHEVTHMILFDINPAVLQKRWLNEGIVWYLSANMDTPAMRRLDKSWMGADLQSGAVPRMAEIASDSQKIWERRKGDFYSREFVRFVVERFGADKLPAMVQSPRFAPRAGEGRGGPIFGVAELPQSQIRRRRLTSTYFGLCNSRVRVWKTPGCCPALMILNPASRASVW